MVDILDGQMAATGLDGSSPVLPSRSANAKVTGIVGMASNTVQERPPLQCTARHAGPLT